MATTLKKGPLQVSITETYTLNNREHNIQNISIHSDIREVGSRIVACPDAATTDLVQTGATAGYGAYITGDIRYVRFTNLDDENVINITIAGDITAAIPLEANGSLSMTLSLGGATTFRAINTAGADVDVEVFVASV